MDADQRTDPLSTAMANPEADYHRNKELTDYSLGYSSEAQLSLQTQLLRCLELEITCSDKFPQITFYVIR